MRVVGAPVTRQTAVTGTGVNVNRLKSAFGVDGQGSGTSKSTGVQSLSSTVQFFNNTGIDNRTMITSQGLPSGLFAGKNIDLIA